MSREDKNLNDVFFLLLLGRCWESVGGNVFALNTQAEGTFQQAMFSAYAYYTFHRGGRGGGGYNVFKQKKFRLFDVIVPATSILEY